MCVGSSFKTDMLNVTEQWVLGTYILSYYFLACSMSQNNGYMVYTNILSRYFLVLKHFLL